LIPVTSAKWFAEALPQAKMIIYPNVGHIPMEEIPEKSGNDVKIWLDDVVAKTPKV
jgi:pimeloyl-ACP methyl ester carboxylesterase